MLSLEHIPQPLNPQNQKAKSPNSFLLGRSQNFFGSIQILIILFQK